MPHDTTHANVRAKNMSPREKTGEIAAAMHAIVYSFDAAANCENYRLWSGPGELPDREDFASNMRAFTENAGDTPPPEVSGLDTPLHIDSAASPKVVIYALVQTLQVAGPEESGRIMAALTRMTGRNLGTPEEWLAWWKSTAPAAH